MDEKKNTKTNRVISNLIWRFLERFGAQGVTLIVSIILARLLEPVVYGTVALITVITTVLQVFVDSGLGLALIQKKDADALDFSTVFFANIALCVIIYLGLFLAAPLIARFYSMDELTKMIRVMGLLLIISGVKNVQNSYVSKNLLFKKYFFATLGGTLAASIIGIWMAFIGCGVWALIVQNLINQFIDAVILWFTVGWRPRLMFSFKRFRVLFSFGWKLLVATLLDTIYKELRQLIIGKKYSKEDLAFYNKGNEYPNKFAGSITDAINSVLLPIMADEQNDKERVKTITRTAIKSSSFILSPIMLGFAGCSKSFVSLFLTDKWLPVVPYLMISCLVYIFYPIHTSNLNAIKAMGRSDYFLTLEIIKKIMGLAIIIVTVRFGVIWIALGSIISTICSTAINSWPNKKLLDYSWMEQMHDLLPALCLSGIMFCIVYGINFLGLSSWSTLLIQIPLGVVVYIGGAAFFKLESFSFCLRTFKKLINKK